MNLLVAAFLAAHGLIHTSYMAPAPPAAPNRPEWPFAMDRSWLVTAFRLDPQLVTSFGTALVVMTTALLAGAALATGGWVVPGAWWPGLTAAGATASVLTLVLFFHPWLVLGLVIDAALLWGVLVAHWVPAVRP